MLSFDDLKLLVGELPKKVALDTAIIGQSVKDGYEEIKIEYGVEENERVTAFLLLPNAPKVHSPAIFCHHQHASNFEIGKSEIVGHAGDPEQALIAASM